MYAMEQAMHTVTEEREEIMIVPASNPTRRLAHFLTPSLSSSYPSFDLPPTAFCSNHQNLTSLCPTHVSFAGWKKPLRKWNSWVEKMKPVHQSVWHNAGIYHAIIASTYQIKTDTDLVLALSERWCPQTNSFVFPWGEATISLEDIMILGGYSVLGHSVISEIEARDEEEFIGVDEKFNKMRAEINKSKSKKVSQGMWIESFMDSGSSVEHEAFLVLWLSRHVFPFSHGIVGKQFHKIAFWLAKGTRLALGPHVLACLYWDLRSLKKKIVDCSEESVIGDKLNLWSQMQFVQIWAWERFPSIRPEPNFTGEGEPRMARWNNTVNVLNLETVRTSIDRAAETFVWRPYAMSEKFEFFTQKEKSVSICPGMSEDFISFARFVRVSQLVGLNFIEPYFPHRVSMQFGMDQDIPGKVARFDDTLENAWKFFNRPVGDEKLYIPSRVFESAVTRRYLNWWKDSKLVQKNVVECNDDELLLGTDSGSSKKRKAVVEDITSSKRKTVNKAISKIKGDRKANEFNKKMGNDQSIEIINVAEISSDDTYSPRVEPRIPKYPPGYEPNEIQIEGTVSSDMNEEQEARAKRLKQLRELPLETRISRCEMLVAQLKKERLRL